jgi:hypothetical protein
MARTTMTSNYEAWNGELYEWPPPDGWYRASDGRWWAQGTGPGPAEQASTVDVEVDAATRVMYQPESDPVTTLDTAPKPVPPMHRTGPIPVVDVARQWPESQDEGYAAAGKGFATNGVSSSDIDRTTPLLADSTGPVSVVTHDEGKRPLRPFGLHPAVLVAGLLVLAAIGVAVVLAAASGNDGDLATTDDPTVVDGEEAGDGSTAESQGGDGQSADGADDAMSVGDQGMSDGQSMDGSMDSEADSMADPMGDGGDSGDGTATTTGQGTSDTVDLTQNLEAVTEFRATLDELGITSGDLSAEEIVTFGQSACGYATGSDGLDSYVETRDEALAAADNEELTVEELSSVVDAAVRVFCPVEATRLGL